ncbi:hypothetical protein AURDEDRAFT_161957 [Auricularia subglabra TFB-10046 SS5]|nr:hypothetical protein AURDEDRAFT_161957 [Auricularia subglabra TFB-10046 SS5]
MLDRGDNKHSSLDLSLRISLSSPRLAYTPDCLPCLAIISLFPDGLSEDEGIEIFYGRIPAVRKCVMALKRAALVYSEMGRLRVLAPIRGYVLKHHPPLESHLIPLMDYCLHMAEACSQMADADSGGAITSVTSEIGNLQAVLLHLVSHTSLGPDMLSALVDLDWCLLYMGFRSSNIELLREGLKCAQRVGDRGYELDLQTRLGRYAEHGEKLVLLSASIATARELGDPLREAEAEYHLSTWTRQGRLDLSRDCAERALALYLSLPESPKSGRGQQECYASLANNEYHVGDYRKAREYVARALALRETAGRAANALQLRCTMAGLTFMLGEYDTAEESMTSALALAREAQDGHAAYLALNGLAGISSVRGDTLLALSQIREAGAWCKRLRMEDNEAWCARYAAFIHLEREEFEDAQALLSDAMPVFKRLGNTWGEGNTELAFAILANALGDREACAIHFERVNTIARTNRFTELQAEAIMEAGTIALGRGDADRALMNFAAAFAY